MDSSRVKWPEIYRVVMDFMPDHTPPLTPEEVEVLIKSSPVILLEIEQWGVRDTVVREEMMDVLAQKLIGRQWPQYAQADLVAALPKWRSTQ
jgi:hypothetical protein